jgi:hypothetical protein
MSFDEGKIGFGKPKRDIVERLAAVKQGHGNYRQAQDALVEIVAARKRDADKNRRIMELETRIAELERQLPRVAA